MPFSLELCRRVARLRTLVLVTSMFTVAACGDTVDPTSPDTGDDVMTVVPAGNEPLADGDDLRIGSVPMTFRCFGAELATETRRD